jgi:hypothetical protein
MIAGCAARAGPVADGISALNKACPGVEGALIQLRLMTFMPSGWRKTLTTHGLADVDALLQRYSESRPSQQPRAAALRSIAADLAPPQVPLTWWGRVGAWIRRSLLQPLNRWLRSLGPELRSAHHSQAIFLAAAALLLAAVVAVLAMELRGSGLSRLMSRATRPPRRGRSVADSTESAAALPVDPDWTLLRGQPARVLRLLVATLISARRLECDRNLTCRELETQARFETERDRAGFSRVALLAERELYGPPGTTVLADETLRNAQTLYAQLLTACGKGGDVAR